MQEVNLVVIVVQDVNSAFAVVRDDVCLDGTRLV